LKLVVSVATIKGCGATEGVPPLLTRGFGLKQCLPIGVVSSMNLNIIRLQCGYSDIGWEIKK